MFEWSSEIVTSPVLYAASQCIYQSLATNFIQIHDFQAGNDEHLFPAWGGLLIKLSFPAKFILNSNRFVTNFVTAFVLVSGSILNLYISSFCSMNKTEACFDHLAQFLCFLVHKLFLFSSRAIASVFLYLDSYCT